MSKILVSINCITYNHEKYIDSAINSFLAQETNFKFEILIHDDASTDKTPDIIRKYEKKYPDIIKPIYQIDNKYSKGIKVDNINNLRARGKYIAFCEGDDYWIDKHKLQKQVDYMESNINCSMCFHSAKIVDINKGKVGEVRPYIGSCLVATKDMILGGGNFCASASLMYKSELVSKLPDFYMDAHVSDYPLQLFFASQGDVYYIDDCMSVYRVGDSESWTNKNLFGENMKEKRIKNINNDIKLLEEFNKETQNKYCDVVNKAILKCNYNIALFNENIVELKRKEYRQLYSDINNKLKMKIYIKSYFPNVYIKLDSIKKVIKGIILKDE